MRSLGIAGALALALVSLGAIAAPPAIAAHHEPVTQVVTVDVKPGQLEKYRQEVEKLMGVMERLGSKATLRMWQTTAGGPDTGNVLVGVEYPDAGSWAADGETLANDAEWQEITSGLDALRTVVSTSLWRDVSTAPGEAGTGKVLLITGVDVKPGKLDAYREKVADLHAIAERLELGGSPRIWHAEVAGPGTGAVVVGIQHDDLADYVADRDKLAMDAEWQKLLGELDTMRTVTGRWLYRDITP